MKKYLFLIIATIYGFNSYAQKDIYNTSLIFGSLSDTTIASFPQLAYPENFTDSVLANKTYKQALQFAQRLTNKKDETLLHIMFGNYLYGIGDFSLAQLEFNKGLAIANIENFKREEAIAMKGIAHIAWRQGENIQSVESILKSIDIFKNLNDTLELISSGNVLAGVYVSLNKINEADSIYSLMLNHALQLNDSVSIAQNYEYKGIIQFFKGDYKKAIDYYSNSLKLNEALQLEVQAGINYANIGEALLYLNRFEEALQHYTKAKMLLEKHQHLSALTFVNYGLGQIHTKLDRYSQGIEHYLQSLKLVEQTGEHREKPIIYGLMVENYLAQKNYQAAFNHMVLKNQIDDSIDNVDKTRQLEEIKAKYELDKKEELNKRLVNENILKENNIKAQDRIILIQGISVVALFGFLLILVFLFYKMEQQRKQLRATNETKDKLFNILSHDLRGPIGNLKSLSEFMIEDIANKNNEKFKAMLIDNKALIDNSYAMINDLLIWSISRSESLITNQSSTNLKQLVEKTIIPLKRISENKEIKINIHIEDTVHVLVDEGAISSVIRNLVGNAIKFTPRGGIINISSKAESNAHEVCINDRGIGMTKEQLENLFKVKHFRKSVGTENEVGSGIGLTICKDIIEQSGGKIWATSEIEVGSSFYFTLPAG